MAQLYQQCALVYLHLLSHTVVRSTTGGGKLGGGRGAYHIIVHNIGGVVKEKEWKQARVSFQIGGAGWGGHRVDRCKKELKSTASPDLGGGKG